MNQWYDLLLSSFQAEVGLIGGGYFETGALTVTTYASAFRFMERLGNQFGLLIFDECHHLAVERLSLRRGVFASRRFASASPRRLSAGRRGRMLEQLSALSSFAARRTSLRASIFPTTACCASRRTMRRKSARRTKASAPSSRSFLRDKGIGLGSLRGFQLFVAASARCRKGVAARCTPTANRSASRSARTRNYASCPNFFSATVASKRPDLHRRERDGLSHLAQVSYPFDYARDRRQRAPRLARSFQQGRGACAGDLEGLERGRQYSRRHRSQSSSPARARRASTYNASDESCERCPARKRFSTKS